MMKSPRRRTILTLLLLLAIGAGIWFWLQHAAGVRASRAAAAFANAPAEAAAAKAKADAAQAAAAADGSRIIVSDPQTTQSAAATVSTVPGRDASWLDIQQTENLRSRINQAQQSNDQQEAAAAMNALVYCSNFASKRAVGPAEAAATELEPFPAQEALLRRSPVQRRGDEVELARKRCSFGDDPQLRAAELELRRTLSARLEGINDLVRRLRQSPGIDAAALTAEDRALLASGRLDVLSSVLGGLGDRWGQLDEGPPVANDIAAQLARHLAACRIGDACGPSSFRFAEVCVRLGGCDGGGVEQAIDRLVVDEATRQRMFRLSTRIQQQLSTLAKPP